MRLKVLSLFAAALLLAACQTTPETSKATEGAGGAAAKGAAAAPTTGAETGGMPAVAPGTQADLEANVGDRVFFDFDKSDIRSDAKTRLDSWVSWLNTYPQVTVVIEGHCDERGTREYNLALGERRAAAAKNYLVAAGINAGRVQTISYGKERPAVLGSNEAAWAQNRRAVMVVQ
ncbi:MAG: peptidoglycan-associated lipoprotein Pal [Alphaproteobacteria bacterium]